jgi:hypothetical protein
MTAVAHVTVDLDGKPSSTAHVTTGGAAAVLYTDGTGNTPAGDNSLTVASDGTVAFYAAPGDYKIAFTNRNGHGESHHVSVQLATGGAFRVSDDVPVDGAVLSYDATSDEYVPSTDVSVATLETSGAATVGGDLLHAGTHVGFFGHSGATKPALSYSRATANETAAEAALRAALAGLGLITDNTTT